jgi:hypothetical protein
MPTGISQLKNGNRIKITWLPKVYNSFDGSYEPNAYIGWEGVVENLSPKGFDLVGDSGILLCYGKSNKKMKWELIEDQEKGDK